MDHIDNPVLSAVSNSKRSVRCDTAAQIISLLYNVQFEELSNGQISAEFCVKNRLHHSQYYFSEKVLDMTCQSLEQGFIYHICDTLYIHIMLFTVCGIPYVFGPFCCTGITETSARTLLKKQPADAIDVRQYLAYRDSFPIIKEVDALNIVFSFLHVISPEESGKTVKRIAGNHEFEDRKNWSEKSAHPNRGAKLERRYMLEQQFIDDIICGNTSSALNNLHRIEQNVSYLKRNGSSLEGERIGAAITRTTVRLAAVRAGLPPALIDKLSSKNTIQAMTAKSCEDIHLAKDNMIRDFCKAILELRNNKYTALVQSTIYYLNRNYSKKCSLADLAEEMEVSKSRLAAAFKKEVGTSFSAYLAKIRVQSAAHLLLNGKIQVSDIAASVGVDDPNYFVKLFKKEFGETPTAYRRRYIS